jgi:uncharacterized membrane protein YqgA involved in biofilm formation
MGTIINVIAVFLGSLLGLLVRSKITEELKIHILNAIGLVTILIGVQMGLNTENILIPLGGLLLGGIIGHFAKIEKGIDFLAEALKNRFADKNSIGFTEGFVTASLIFCVGPLTVLGSINDGISGDYQLLAVKSVLDGFTSLALASAFGIGVMFSIASIIAVQGGLTIFAFYLSPFFSENVINETTAVGGIIIIGLGVTILGLKKISNANFLPAIFITPLLVKAIIYIKQLL